MAKKLDEFNIISLRLGCQVKLMGRAYINQYGEEFINVDNASLDKAFSIAAAVRNAVIDYPAEVASATASHPAFVCRIQDIDGQYMPQIGEADRASAPAFWKDKLYMLAHMRCIGRTIIHYLDFDCPQLIYAFCEGVKGTPKDQWLAEQDLAAQPIPAIKDIPETTVSNDTFCPNSGGPEGSTDAFSGMEDIVRSMEGIHVQGIRTENDLLNESGVVNKQLSASYSQSLQPGNVRPAEAMPGNTPLKSYRIPMPPAAIQMMAAMSVQEDPAKEVITFGKYAGFTFDQAWTADPAWVRKIALLRGLSDPEKEAFARKAELYISRKERTDGSDPEKQTNICTGSKNCSTRISL